MPIQVELEEQYLVLSADNNINTNTRNNINIKNQHQKQSTPISIINTNRHKTQQYTGTNTSGARRADEDAKGEERGDNCANGGEVVRDPEASANK